MLVAKGVQVVFNALTENARKAWEQVKRVSEDSAKRIADDIKSVNDTMREQLAVIDRIASRRKDELAAVKELTKAEIELARKVIVGQRCKGAGMHWHYENALYVTALRARMRSAA